MSWLGTWDAAATALGNCPGPGPKGEWPWAFKVVEQNGNFRVEVTEPDQWAGRVLAISERWLRFVLNDPYQQEINLRMNWDGRSFTGESFMHKPPGGMNDPCAKSKQRGVIRPAGGS